MANTKSAKKNVRSSARKKAGNTFWKTKIKDVVKSIKEKAVKPEDLIARLKALQKAADKAVKEKVIHKNRANRLKSTYARKIAALFSTSAGKQPAGKTTAGKSAKKS